MYIVAYRFCWEWNHRHNIAWKIVTCKHYNLHHSLSSHYDTTRFHQRVLSAPYGIVSKRVFIKRSVKSVFSKQNRIIAFQITLTHINSPLQGDGRRENKTSCIIFNKYLSPVETGYPHFSLLTYRFDIICLVLLSWCDGERNKRSYW